MKEFKDIPSASFIRDWVTLISLNFHKTMLRLLQWDPPPIGLVKLTLMGPLKAILGQEVLVVLFVIQGAAFFGCCVGR